MYSWRTAAVQSAFGIEQRLPLVLLHHLDQGAVTHQQAGVQQAEEAAQASF